MGRSAEPFLGQEAVARGQLSAWELRTRFRRIYRNVYVPKEAVLTAADRARAAWLWSGGAATVVGVSAAALHGTKWISPDFAAELCRADRRHPAGIRIHTYALEAEDLCWVDGMRVTTPARTAFDVARQHIPDRSIPLLDALVGATDLRIPDVLKLAEARPGVRGRRRLHTVMSLVDGGAESPQETRVRLLLVRAGLPVPQTQIRFTGDFGTVRGIRVDMGWPEWRVAVEYDGIQHWDDAEQRSWDIDRLAHLESLGWAVVRVSAAMLSRPDVIVERVTAKLRRAGWPG